MLTDFDGFRLSILIPTTISFLSLVFLFDQGHVTDSNLSITSILEDFKLQIALLSTSIPLAALFAAVHRSQQTAIQIEVQQEQNNFINHFKHLEEFKKAFKGDKLPFPWKSSEELHLDIYPNTKSGDLYPALLCDKPDNILAQLFEQIHLSPFNTQNLCNKHYLSIVKQLGPQPRISPQKITPIHFLKLFDSLNKAYSFAALHPPRFNYDRKFIIKAREISDLLKSVEYLSKSKVLDQLQAPTTSPLAQKLLESTTFLKRFNFDEFIPDDYLLLALAATWRSIISDLDDAKRDELINSLPERSQTFIWQNIEPSYQLGLKDLMKESNRLLGTS
jgi:hypothetical protein